MRVAVLSQYPNYVITDQGQIQGPGSGVRASGTPKWLGLVPNHKGYLRVRISTQGKQQLIFVHKLVALAFVGERPSPKHQVCHVNGDRTDNRAVNLRWGTAKENSEDRDRHGKTARGTANGRSKLTPDQVSEIKAQLAVGATNKGLARLYGVAPSTIKQIRRGETWTSVPTAKKILATK